MNCKKNVVEPREMSACEVHRFHDELEKIYEAERHTSAVKIFNKEEIAQYINSQQSRCNNQGETS